MSCAEAANSRQGVLAGLLHLVAQHALDMPVKHMTTYVNTKLSSQQPVGISFHVQRNASKGVHSAAASITMSRRGVEADVVHQQSLNGNAQTIADAGCQSC